MHALVAGVFESGNKTKTIIRERPAFGHVFFELVPVKELSVVGHAYERATGGDENLSQFSERELSIGVCAMSVNNPFEHSTPLFPRFSFSAWRATVAARNRASRQVRATGRAA
jgi:hypothetical protein